MESYFKATLWLPLHRLIDRFFLEVVTNVSLFNEAINGIVVVSDVF